MAVFAGGRVGEGNCWRIVVDDCGGRRLFGGATIVVVVVPEAAMSTASAAATFGSCAGLMGVFSGWAEVVRVRWFVGRSIVAETTFAATFDRPSK